MIQFRQCIPAIVFILSGATILTAQTSSWFERSDRAKQEQPHWITPLATTTPRLEQEFRYDILWQQAKPGTNYTENLGGSKGLELIPLDRVQVLVGVPPYFIRHNSGSRSGLGDFRLMLKYRLLAASEAEGNYILTVFFRYQFPNRTEREWSA